MRANKLPMQGCILSSCSEVQIQEGELDAGTVIREFWERGCKVKIEAKRDEYKKEVKCEDDG
ncbi:hypothetical protein PS685_05007 [Pseudomonas fluorescens]|jgi:hypothetical protein|uniref:Lipoprotein n=1 Tax=Pseudomonas fluorescens TaxID=294 RepID=A0A5E6ZXJ0_PSEFL|nr:hypothetical protein PS685_05007 [Pseudomonas fluorescens]